MTNVGNEELRTLIEQLMINQVNRNIRNEKKRTKRNSIEEEAIMGTVNNVIGVNRERAQMRLRLKLGIFYLRKIENIDKKLESQRY